MWEGLQNVPGRPVISNCGIYTGIISWFLDYYLQPLAQDVKSYIKDRLKAFDNFKNK